MKIQIFKYSTENKATNIIVPLHSGRWLLDLSWLSHRKVYKYQDHHAVYLK